MPKITQQHRLDIERDARVSVFANKTQGEIYDIIDAMEPEERIQLKQDISELNLVNCGASTYEAITPIDRALNFYGLGIFTKLLIPKVCPDCGFEWDRHNPNCPQVGEKYPRKMKER